MAKIRQQSRYNRSRRGQGCLHIAMLAGLAILVVWILTWDLADTFAIRWLTDQQDAPVNNEKSGEALQIKKYTEGTFAVSLDDDCPRWISAHPMALASEDSVIFSYEDAYGYYQCVIPQTQRSIWTEYTRQAKAWRAQCDSIYIIYGRARNESSIYTVNLCVSDHPLGIAYILPDTLTSFPLIHYAVSIDSAERWSGLDFFNDILADQDEQIIESRIERMKWSMNPQYFEERLSANKALKE